MAAPLTQAYVFAQLAGDPRPVGTVRLTPGGYEFGYARSWLGRSDAFALDPIHLPLREQSFLGTQLFSALADSLPDDWGRRVFAAIHRQQPANEVEALLVTRGTGVGCLLYSGSKERVKPPAAVPAFADLARIAQAASEVEARRVVQDEGLVRLLWFGSSMGGARPKATVAHEGREWIAKFAREGDLFDHALAEKAFQLMAADAGLPVMESRVVAVAGGNVLLIERFDRRPGGERLHYISARTLLSMYRIGAADERGDFSYAGIADGLKRCAFEAVAQLRQLYRRMAFNLAIANTDDHLLNHGLLYLPGRGYGLAPVFDVVPNPRQPELHAIGLGSDGRRASLANLLSRHAKFGLDRHAAVEEIAAVLAVVGRCDEYFERVGMAAVDRVMHGALCRRYGQAELDAAAAAA